MLTYDAQNFYVEKFIQLYTYTCYSTWKGDAELHPSLRRCVAMF